MNEKQIKKLLHHADAEALEQIAAACPAADTRTEQRLFRRFRKRITPGAEQLQEEAVSVTYEVGTRKRSVLPMTIGAVLCAVAMTVTGLAFLGKRPETAPQPQLAAETTTNDTEFVDTDAVADDEEVADAADADRPEESTPEIATGIGIDLPAETSLTDAEVIPITQTETANPTSTTSVQTTRKSGKTTNTETKATTGATKPETSKETTTTKTTAPSVFDGTEKLFWEDVVALSKKGDELTWADFAKYEGEDIGSGLFVMKYEIADLNGAYLLVCDAETVGKPAGILIETDDPDDYFYGHSMDIRSEECQALLAYLDVWANRSKNKPKLSGTQCCYLAWYDGFAYNAPVVIKSVKELEDFYETNFFSVALEDWDESWIIDGISHNFKTTSAKYDDAFFAEHDLVLVFWQTPVAENCLEVTDLTADEWNNWTIHIKEYPIGFTAQLTSWCLFVETNKAVEAANSLGTNVTRADKSEMGYEYDNDLWKSWK